MTTTLSDVQVGTVLPTLTVPVTRMMLVRYAGASGDFNPIHWNESFARSVGLPDVIAHGMLTMALSGRLVTAWCGDPSALIEHRVRFSAPLVVPNDWDGAELVVSGSVVEVRDDGTAVVEIKASCGEDAVLSHAEAIVRLP